MHTTSSTFRRATLTATVTAAVASALLSGCGATQASPAAAPTAAPADAAPAAAPATTRTSDAAPAAVPAVDAQTTPAQARPARSTEAAPRTTAAPVQAAVPAAPAAVAPPAAASSPTSVGAPASRDDDEPEAVPTWGPPRVPDPSTAAVPEGSGCTPGTQELPDGRWFGQLEPAPQTGAPSFNLMCWFEGEAAVAAAQEDGWTGEAIPLGLYTRDDNPQRRTVPVADHATATAHVADDHGNPETLPFADYWQRDPALRIDSVWLTVSGGEVTSVVEQWTP